MKKTERIIKRAGMVGRLMAAAFAVVFLAGLLSKDVLAEGEGKSISSLGIANGIYTMGTTIEGGWIGTEITDPARVRIKDGEMTALLEFESEYYTGVKAGGQTIEPKKRKGNSQFVIPVPYTDAPFTVTVMKTEFGQTMQTDLTVCFHSSDYEKASSAFNPGRSSIRAGFAFFMLIIVAGGVMLFLHKKMESWGAF